MREIPEFSGMSREDVLIESAQKYHPDVYKKVVTNLTEEHDKAVAAQEAAEKQRLAAQKLAERQERDYMACVQAGREAALTMSGFTRLLKLAEVYPYDIQNLCAILGADTQLVIRTKDGYSAPEYVSVYDRIPAGDHSEAVQKLSEEISAQTQDFDIRVFKVAKLIAQAAAGEQTPDTAETRRLRDARLSDPEGDLLQSARDTLLSVCDEIEFDRETKRWMELSRSRTPDRSQIAPSSPRKEPQQESTPSLDAPKNTQRSRGWDHGER